jgi:hypothetical protein
MTGNDCYALRCAYLHQGLDDVSTQRVEKVLSGFIFSEPPTSGDTHRNQFNNVLQLQVDVFCRELCDGVIAWLTEVADDGKIQNAIAKLMMIKPTGESFTMTHFPGIPQ